MFSQIKQRKRVAMKSLYVIKQLKHRGHSFIELYTLDPFWTQIFLKWSCACKPHAHVRMRAPWACSWSFHAHKVELNAPWACSWKPHGHTPGLRHIFEILNNHALLRVKYNRLKKYMEQVANKFFSGEGRCCPWSLPPFHSGCYELFSNFGDGGPCSWVYAHETLCSGPHRC